jgi:hypothetical protein
LPAWWAWSGAWWPVAAAAGAADGGPCAGLTWRLT